MFITVVIVMRGDMASFLFVHFVTSPPRLILIMIVTGHSSVPLAEDLLMFLIFQIRLHTKHPRNTYKSQQQKDDLYERLAGIELLIRVN
jgi:hypothetical protein